MARKLIIHAPHRHWETGACLAFSALRAKSGESWGVKGEFSIKVTDREVVVRVLPGFKA